MRYLVRKFLCTCVADFVSSNQNTTSTLCTCESSHLDFKCGSARGGGIGYHSTTCMKGIVYLDMLIGLWRSGDGGGTVKKESKKEVETVANNYSR